MQLSRTAVCHFTATTKTTPSVLAYTLSPALLRRGNAPAPGVVVDDDEDAAATAAFMRGLFDHFCFLFVLLLLFLVCCAAEMRLLRALSLTTTKMPLPLLRLCEVGSIVFVFDFCCYFI
jgi:hypothetical protein